MIQCKDCRRVFPDRFIQPMHTTIGMFSVCAICALSRRNKMHGLNDSRFVGEMANKLLRETRKYLKERV